MTTSIQTMTPFINGTDARPRFGGQRRSLSPAHDAVHARVDPLEKKMSWLKRLVFLALPMCALHAGNALAACSFTPATQMATNSVVTLASLTPPRNAPVGTLLWDSGWQGSDSVRVHCQGGEAVTLSYTTSMEMVYGMTGVYKTQVPGIGIRAAYTNTTQPPPENILNVNNNGSWLLGSTPYVLEPNAQPVDYTPLGRFRVQLIVIGPLTQGGTISFPSPTAQMKYGNLVSNMVSFSSSNVQLSFKTCSVTQNTIKVELPTVSVTLLPQVGSRAEPQDFTLDLKCDQGVNVSYQIDGDIAPSTVAGDGILATRQGPDQAAGIGIQLRQGNTTTPVPLGQVVSSGLVSTSDLEPLNVHLTASYYRTGASVTSGEVNAVATFTMSYQ